MNDTNKIKRIQPRNERGHYMGWDGTRPEKKLYTQSDLDKEIAQAFLSGTKQSRINEIVTITKPDHELLRQAFMAGTNASKSGLVTPSVQFERWLKSENL